ncbi:Gfo/Idh/MocA family protein [Paenibacillus mesophilus]|uniref:Gfo/Idh/MocA family protein n=1 Tax=Paenibacillus mesophilus TaxID=2582849 RepID=UPI0023688E0F|nr:Gfo/Idh/MocA family oxidoreductase [Paenibacillus mesophilus]
MSIHHGKIRGSVIGYGGAFNMGRMHANEMKRVGFDFVAACDMDPLRMEQAQQDFPGIQTFINVEEMLAQPDIDLVVVITPHNTHARLAEQILRSGKHCILEKPMCIHAEDAHRLVQLAKANGLMLTVFHNRRFDSWYLTVKDLIRQGELGDIYNIEILSGNFSAPRGWWRDSKEISGGALYDWGAHFIDHVLGLIPGKVGSVRGYVQNRVWHEKTNEDQINSIIQFENGAVAHIQISSIDRAGRQIYRIKGTKGDVEITDLKKKALNLYRDIDGQNTLTEVDFLSAQHHRYYENIADHLLNGVELVVKPEEARRVIAIIETTGISAEAGKELRPAFEGE